MPRGLGTEVPFTNALEARHAAGDEYAGKARYPLKGRPRAAPTRAAHRPEYAELWEQSSLELELRNSRRLGQEE